MQGPFRNITPGGELSSRGLKRNADYLGGLYALDAPEGMAFHQGATGTSLQDQRPKRHWAIIQDALSSSSQSSGTSSGIGIGETGLQIASDMVNAYEAIFAQWVVENDTYVCKVMPEQPKILALEANGSPDVPDGAIVELIPGPGMPDVYFFFWTPGDSSSSDTDGPWCFEVDCPNGTIHVTDCHGSSSTTTPGNSSGGTSSSKSSSGNLTTQPNGGTGGSGGGKGGGVVV